MKIPFSKPSISEQEIEAVNRVLKSGWLAAGLETEAFEDEFAEYIAERSNDGLAYSKPYCIFTNSCTSALKMAYKWAKEQGVDGIIYPKNTFCATYSAAEEMGLKTATDHSTFFVEDFYNIRNFTSYTTTVHFGGVKDESMCQIEDSAHRIEPDDPLIGKIRCYSFYATKNMTANGRGGMAVTNDKEIYERLRLYWRDGLTTTTRDRATGINDYEVKAFSGGYDGNDVEVACARVQLTRLPQFTKRRNEIRDRYNQAFGLSWQGNHLYVVDVGSIESVHSCRQFLYDHGIGSGFHYPGTGWTSISLPIFPDLTDSEQDQVIEAVKEWSERNV